MSLDKLVEKWMNEAADLAARGWHEPAAERIMLANELKAALAAGDGAVAQLTTFEDTNSFSARMHDVVHDLPAGTYSLYLHPAGAVQVTDEDIRWLEDNHEALIEAGGSTNNMRAVAVRRAINALSPGGSRE